MAMKKQESNCENIVRFINCVIGPSSPQRCLISGRYLSVTIWKVFVLTHLNADEIVTWDVVGKNEGYLVLHHSPRNNN